MTKPTMPAKILLIEEDPIIQLVHRSMLQKLGFEVDTTNSGQEALILHSKEQYAGILLELDLPDISGERVLEIMRRQEQSAKRQTPIIIVTTHDLTKHKKSHLKKQVNDYLQKPISIDRLSATLAACIHIAQKSEY